VQDLERAHELVERYGWNTTCYQILNPGISHWFGPESVVGYVCKAGVTIVAGAPICPADQLAGVQAEFEKALGPRICYFGAEDRLHDLARSTDGYSTVSLGAQPVWRPAEFCRAVTADRSLRAQLNRATNKGVCIQEWSAANSEGNAALKACLTWWLQHRGLPPMHFLVEPETLHHIFGRRIFVAQRGPQVIGFLTLAPIPDRCGYLTEQFIRGPDAPNGTVELMVEYAARTIAKEGCDFFTMGIVPLSRKASGQMDTPRWLIGLSAWMRAHGRRFYNFEGLEWFKQKFHPDRWEPVYAISKERSFSFRTLYAIAAAFTDQPPWLAVTKGFGRAIRQEFRWFGRPRA